MQACFDAGAGALIGWPSADILAGLGGRIQPDPRSLQRLGDLVRKEASIDVLERVVLREPILAYRLLRHLMAAMPNLPAQGNLLRHGLLMNSTYVSASSCVMERCAACHGVKGEGTTNFPALVGGKMNLLGELLGPILYLVIGRVE